MSESFVPSSSRQLKIELIKFYDPFERFIFFMEEGLLLSERERTKKDEKSFLFDEILCENPKSLIFLTNCQSEIHEIFNFFTLAIRKGDENEAKKFQLVA